MVNKTIGQTAQNVTTGNPAPGGSGMFEGLLVGIFEQQALVLGLGLLGLGAYFLYKKFEDEEMFEGRDPDEVTRKWLKRQLSNGKKVDKQLIEKNNGSLLKRGNIKYEYYDRMPSDTISPVINPDSNSKEEFNPSEQIYLARVIPENESKLKFILFDVLLGKDMVSEYYSLNDDNIEVYDDEVVISEDINLDYDRGVFNDRTTSSKNKLNQIIRMESQNELVKGHLNYAPKVNFMSPNHSMDLDKIKESKEDKDEI